MIFDWAVGRRQQCGDLSDDAVSGRPTAACLI